MDWNQIDSYVYGYGFSCLVGGMVIYLIWCWMWKIVDPDKKHEKLRTPRKLACFHGVVERAFFTSCIVLGRPEGVAVWLAFKALQRVRIGEQTDYTHVPGTAAYLTGTAFSVAFGVIGGMIAIGAKTLAPSIS